MAKSIFKVLFYVNGSKGKNGIVLIMGRVIINGAVAQFSCKQTIPETFGMQKVAEPKTRGLRQVKSTTFWITSRCKSSSTTCVF